MITVGGVRVDSCGWWVLELHVTMEAEEVVTRGFWVGLGFCILGLNVVGLPRFVYVSSSSLFLLTITRSPRFLFTITFIAFFSGQVETEATAFFR
ncbi:hypothetical protein L1887_29076 [Cichorium endivia]|nr:hypothetical protein L1887_29076 [Cichorium endivia]